MLLLLLLWAIIPSAGLAIRNLTMYGNSTLGYYYIEAFVGTPPQKKALIFDTGSHLTIFPCYGCYSCRNHLYNIFDTSKSTSFNIVSPTRSYFDWRCMDEDEESDQCMFKQLYTEGSEYSGFYAIDNFVFENELKSEKSKSLKHVFGCAMKETDQFLSQEVDGIIGFGAGSKSIRKFTSEKPSTLDT